MTHEELAAMRDGDCCYYNFLFDTSAVNVWKKREIDGNIFFEFIESFMDGPVKTEALCPLKDCLCWLLFERCTLTHPLYQLDILEW